VELPRSHYIERKPKSTVESTMRRPVAMTSEQARLAARRMSTVQLAQIKAINAEAARHWMLCSSTRALCRRHQMTRNPGLTTA
jgi:hypothetical protein